mmetsp:Transcript_41249/g.62790  ORF Transcript_41249/g.62790 Transcript_41249/m.62790 type:complete len:284 (-) Transcript_41249:170-1021(-)
MHNLVLGLDNTLGLGLFLFLLSVFVLVHLSIVESLLGFIQAALVLGFLLFFLHLLVFNAMDLLLKLGLGLVDIHVVDERVVRGLFNRHHGGLATLALHVLQNLVVGRQLLLVLLQHAVYAVDGRVRHELLEVRVDEVALHVFVEDHIVGRDQFALVVLIVTLLTNSVGHFPVEAGGAVGLLAQLLLGLGNSVVEANVDEALLVEEALGPLAHHLLARRLDTEALFRLDELSACGQVSRSLHLLEVLLHLGLVFGVRDFIDVVVQHIAEISMLHRLGESLELLG